MAALLALGVGVALMILATPSPASANPRCFERYYVVDTNYGLAHQQIGATETLHNESSVPATLGVSRRVSHTQTTTFTITAGTTVSVKIGDLTTGVTLSTAVAVADAVTIDTTVSVSVTVPPQSTVFAAWGVFLQHTSGPYTTTEYNCDTGDVIRESTSYLDVYSPLSDQPIEGWRVWD